MIIFYDLLTINYYFPVSLHEEEEPEEICNADCFSRFLKDAFSPNNQVCSRLQVTGQMMYASVCATVLSDMEQHKYVDYFTKPALSKKERRTLPGEYLLTIVKLYQFYFEFYIY